MSDGTDAQRDSREIWSQVDRLIDWAGNRTQPMPNPDLSDLRSKLTAALVRLVERSDALERAPLLLAVQEDDDGTKTVVIDMRDGTTQKFQTRVSWLDSAPVAPPDSSELRALQESYADQIGLTEEGIQKNRDLELRVAQLEKLLHETEAEVVKVREEAWAKAEEREAAAEEAAAGNRALFQSRVGEMQALLEDRDRWRDAYQKAAKVIDEALPSTVDLLSERTGRIAKLEEEIAELRQISSS